MLFGFLINNENILFDDVEIKPLPDIQDKIDRFYENVSVSNGFIYPPLQELDKTKEEERKFASKTMVNSAFYTLESTHSISKSNYDEEKIKFLILAYGFLHGVYLRPDGYLCIKKTPYEPGKLTGVLPPNVDDCIKGMKAFSLFYDRSINEQRKLLFSIIHWFLLGQCYEYEWDRFSAQYLVLDSIFNLSGLNASHAERPQILANSYRIAVPNWAITRSVVKNNRNVQTCTLADIRNDLFHEAKYAGEPIGYAYPEENFDLEFARFNLQLIISILGLSSNILRSSVRQRGTDVWNFQ